MAFEAGCKLLSGLWYANQFLFTLGACVGAKERFDQANRNAELENRAWTWGETLDV